ncbi:hypothetical protein KR093_008835, partial [Drosophila rubida]
MSNEENDYLDGMSAHRNGNVDGDGDGDGDGEGNGGDDDGGSGGGGGVAAANDEAAVHGGKTMPQISSNSQLEGNVSPTFTQTTGQFDDNDNQLLANHRNSASQLGQRNQHQHNNSDSNRNSPTKSPTPRGAGHSSSSFQIQPLSARYDDDDDDLAAGDVRSSTNAAAAAGAAAAAAGAAPAGRAGAGGGSAQLPDYWQQRNGGTAAAGSGVQSGHQSRALSPSYADNMSETSEQPPVVPLVRSKSRPELSSAAASRYSNLSYWKARRVVFYRNGDPFFPGVELRYRPGRDVTSLDNLLDKISPKMDLPRGARYVFSMDGDRKYHLDELEDGAFYVVSSFKAFKVS